MVMQNILGIAKTLLPEKPKRFLRTLLGIKEHRQLVVQGYREFCNEYCAKKALLAYLVYPILPPPTKRDAITFSNLGIAQYIPRALNELGYEVDIVSWDDTKWVPEKKYDLFIGHGGINFEHISRRLLPQTVRIYFSTGIYWREFNVREAKRIYDLSVRRGYLLSPDRSIRFSEESASQVADGIICLGNNNAVRSYSKFPLVLGMNNAVYPVQWDGLRQKDFDRGRDHFLFFSGGGNLHKGLDLLLEAFTGTGLHLHICQVIDPLFAEIYHDELTNHPNIHLYGHISMRSEEFERLAFLCNWAISATACEGQPGAILECMAYGLIPILPESANIDLEDFGVPLADENLDTIRSVILSVSKMDVEECKKRARGSAIVVSNRYLPEQFNDNFKKAVIQILEKTPPRDHI